ncbi:hypothetical protein [Alcanivorax sp. DP30]|uniref:DUF6942 family protein n=1 Tax=Alcanivorax sp. DP30 TaxID=2606217 RepID=UPI00136973B0|nr:hypothetical protein [Alcanivorax sp. DP30]MZR63930.1 hypothetical protein [Alcanivorax sp. DP30]
MTSIDFLGNPDARLVLYLPHRPAGLDSFAHAPSAEVIVAANSNHWRKIINLLAKVVSPVADDWRAFRDSRLFNEAALCFAPEVGGQEGWHWIAGQANRERFAGFECQARTLPDDTGIAVDWPRKLLLSPYPDYRQLSNQRVERIRALLGQAGFYAGMGS